MQEEPPKEDIQNNSEREELNTNQINNTSKTTLLETELAEYKDRYLRQLAELENTRKRLQKEKQEAVRFAIENLIEEFLAPLDNLENALECTEKMSEETRKWAKGFAMILAQFKDILISNGIQPFHSKGHAFDPHLHEAVEVDETDEYPDGTVIQEYVRGYRSTNRTIRPARVKVAKTVKPSSKEKLEEDADV